MTPRQTFSAVFAALLLVGATAGAADAATRHRVHRMRAMNHAHSSHIRTMPVASRSGRSQDGMTDRLNAQSLQRAQADSMPPPAQPMMGQPAMGAAPGAVQ
jgi:hypothetical protein